MALEENFVSNPDIEYSEAVITVQAMTHDRHRLENDLRDKRGHAYVPPHPECSLTQGLGLVG